MFERDYLQDLKDKKIDFSAIPQDKLNEDICLEAVRQNEFALKDIPVEMKTPVICLAAVEQNGLTLQHIPPSRRTLAICQAAVKQNGLALQYVLPLNLRTLEICHAAVIQDGLALRFVPIAVPSNMRTLQICQAAVTQNRSALQYASEEFCLAAVKQDGLALQYASEVMKKNSKICLAAVKQNGLALQYASEDMKKNSKICLAAVKLNNGLALQYASEDMKKDQEICLAAVRQDGLALQYASEDMKKNRVICLAAVKQDWRALQYASEEVCLVTVKQDGLALQYASEDMKKDQEICLAAVRQNGLALQYASDNMKKDQVICLAAVKQNGLALQYASDNMKKDQVICLAAVKQDGLALQYASDNMKKDREICLAAVKQNGLTLQYASEDMKKDREICLAAVKQDWRALQYASEDMKKDQEICLAAVKQDWRALQYASDDMKKDREICLVAVKQDGLALQYASDNMKKEEELEIYLEAVKQNYRAFEYVPQELRAKVLQGDDSIMKTMLKNSYDPTPFLNPDDQKAFTNDLDTIRKTILSTCKIVILQPDTKDYELEDIQQLYAQREPNTICVRNTTELSKALKESKELGNKNDINFALVGHTLTGADKIANMQPSAIATLACEYPMIKKITLLGCRTGWSKNLLEEEERNKANDTLKKAFSEQLKRTYPFLDSKANVSRLTALVNDHLWRNGESHCGVRVMVETEGETITPEMMKNGLDTSLDASYFLVKKKTGVAAYYLERDTAEIKCSLISDKLTDDQVKALQKIEELTTSTKGKDEKQHLMSSSEGGWCTNKKGDTAVLNESKCLNDLSKILNHTRNIHYAELPELSQKRTFKRSVAISAQDEKEFEKIAASLAGKVVKELQKKSKGNDSQPSSVEVVKGYRKFLYPDKKGLIATDSLSPLVSEYDQSFFGRAKSNIKPAIKEGFQKEKKYKSVKINVKGK